jgi:hypothetical protein
MVKAKVAHCAGGGTYIEGIARIDQDDAQTIEFGSDGQAIFYSTAAFDDSEVKRVSGAGTCEAYSTQASCRRGFGLVVQM